jgi:hypothetical protein
MATITEDYCSQEVYRLLIEKGFDGEIHTTFDKEGYTQASITLQMAMKWLREVYGLHISLEPCYDYDSMHVVFLAFVQNVADVHEFMDGRNNVASYPNAEKCCELAIKYCLENLI